MEESLTDLVNRLLGEKPKKSKPTPVSSRWREEAIVLHVYHSVCTHCGSEFTAPAPFPFILRIDKKGAAHHDAAPGKYNPMLVDLLPQRVEHIHLQVPTCPNCFAPKEFFQETKQLRLEFPDA